MKCLLCLVLTLLAGSSNLHAASFDGTKGTITLKATSTAFTTVFKISSTDPTFVQFAITLAYRTGSQDGPPIRITTVLSTPPPSSSETRESSAFIAVPQSEILWLSITEIKPGKTQDYYPQN
jgi:hypothetical protein